MKNKLELLEKLDILWTEYNNLPLNCDKLTYSLKMKEIQMLYWVLNSNKLKIKDMAKFRKVNLNIRKGNGYGNYIISADYKGKEIKASTTDSECFDWLEDNSNKEKHLEAKRYVYSKIVSTYNNLY